MADCIFQTEWFLEPPTANHRDAILLLVKSLEQSWQIDTQESALDYIGKRRTKNIQMKKVKVKKNFQKIDIALSLWKEEEPPVKKLINMLIMPNIICQPLFTSYRYDRKRLFLKMYFLGYMVRKLLLCYFKILPIDDRDHFAHKRIHTPGILLATQFYKAFGQMTHKIIASMKNDIKKKTLLMFISYITLPSVITSGLSAAISANKWHKKGPIQGISQELDIFNRASFICTYT